ncbi:MAG: magnesium-dependent phosphatase-1, partial [Planctomycetes bacterium]|nr:magnesium-dependent phosphatase-1 [Planctomycetota bacterium]
MHYKLFVFDLDETLWTVSEGLCSLLKPPFNFTAPDRLETNEGFWIELKPGVHNLFTFLKEQEVYISLASRNDHKPTMEILSAFGLSDGLTYPQIGWRSKDEMLTRIIRSIYRRDKVKIKPDEVFFLDDWPDNIKP